MRFVRALAAVASAVLLISTASAEPAAVLAATEAGSPLVEPGAAQPSPTSTDAAPAALGAAATSQSADHQAADKARPAAVAAVTPEQAATAEPLSPPQPTLFADIDLATQSMMVSDKSGQLYRWPVSSARAGYVTPAGSFTVTWTSRMHYSRQYDWAPMPYAVFFNQGVAVHATNATGSLGRPASHGCVRLASKNARAFYNLVHEHGLALTKIVVRGKPPYSPMVSDRRPRYEEPVFKPFGGFFAYEPPVYRPRKRRARLAYGGGAW